MFRVLTVFVDLLNLLTWKAGGDLDAEGTLAAPPPPRDEQGSGWDPWG